MKTYLSIITNVKLTILFMIITGLTSCQCIESFQKKNSNVYTITKNNLQISILREEIDTKDLQSIYKINNLSEEELKTNELVLFKILLKNLSKHEKTITSFTYQVIGMENKNKNMFLIDSEKRGFIFPKKTKYFLPNKLEKINSKSTVEGFLPFWIPNNSKIWFFTISLPLTFENLYFFDLK